MSVVLAATINPGLVEWFREAVRVSLMSVVESLLCRVERGEAGADRALVDRYTPLVWSLVRRYCRDRAEAEDALQEIMLDVWQSARRGRHDPSRGSDATFIAMIARRRLIDRLRRARPVAAPSAAEVGAAPAAREGDGEDVAAAAEALRELSESQLTAIRLSLLHGLTHEQVAGATGMPLGTVKAHIRRGLIRLREVLTRKSESGQEVAQ